MAIDTMEYVVGAAFVALYSIERITTPPIDLGATTTKRYWGMVLAYAAASIVVYFTCSLILSGPAIQLLAKLELVPAELASASPPMLMALLLTVLLSKIPGLSKLDDAARTEFRHRASMSRIAGNISHLLERKPLNLKQMQKAAVVAYLKEHNIKESDIVFVDNRSPQYTWTRIAVLLEQLRNWESAPAYENFVHAFRSEWDALMADGEKYEAKAMHCFRLSGFAETDDVLSSALKDCRRHYAEQLNVMLKRLSDFMGRGIASACGNHPDRRRAALQKIGIDIDTDVGYTAHQIAFVMVATLIVAVIVPLLMHALTGDESRLDRYLFKIIAGYTIGALVALHLCNRTDTRVAPHMRRPWGRYLLAGVWTVLLTVSFSFVVDVLAGNDPQTIITKLSQWTYVYHLRPFIFAMMIAYMIDTQVAANDMRAQRRIESGVAAAVMAVTSTTIWLLLSGIKDVHPEYSYYLPDVFTMAASSAILGAILGYWLPNSTRHVAERVPDRDPNVAPSPG